MIFLYVRQTIGEYAQWKEGFDTYLAARQAGGANRETLVLRNADDLHEIVVVLGWRDLTTARLYIQSASWQMALQQMEVVGVPEVCFLETVV